MRLSVNGTAYRLWFRYYTHEELGWDWPVTIRAASGRVQHPVTHLTVCTILNESAGHKVYGDAACSVMDQFNKDKGRKLALTRALSGFDRSLRWCFWDKYHRRFDAA